MGNRTKDPVCRKDVTGKSTLCSTYGSKQYCFCSEQCKAEFERDPSAFAK